MKLVPFAAVAISLLVTAPAIAESTTTGTAAKAEKAEVAKVDNKECRRLPVTGTRRTQKVCMTKEEWKKVDEEAGV